jgi:hypothetical protein
MKNMFIYIAKCYQNDQTEEDDKTWHVVQMREKRNAYKNLAREPDGQRQLKIPRHKLEHNIKLELK